MEQILKQKPHPDEVYNKSYKSMKSHIQKSYFAYFPFNLISKPLKQTQNIK